MALSFPGIILYGIALFAHFLWVPLFREILMLPSFLFCGLFTALVAIGTGGRAINSIYFYPKSVQERAVELGLTTQETIKRKRKRFMIPFFLIMFATLILIIGLWNRASDFRQAYLQSLLFLEVMNWYDSIVIDKVWVGYSRFWGIPELEGIPYVQTWKQMLKKRGLLTLIWILGATLSAGMIALIF